MISEAEASCDVDLELLDAASEAIIGELADPGGDGERYERTVKLLARVDPNVRWWLDLIVVASCWASDIPIRPDASLRNANES
jgi:hypothetical protein